MASFVVGKIGVVSIRGPFMTRRQSPTGSQLTLKLKRHQRPSYYSTSPSYSIYSQAILRRCSVWRPGAPQNEHAPLFEQLPQLCPARSRGVFLWPLAGSWLVFKLWIINGKMQTHRDKTRVLSEISSHGPCVSPGDRKRNLKHIQAASLLSRGERAKWPFLPQLSLLPLLS